MGAGDVGDVERLHPARRAAQAQSGLHLLQHGLITDPVGHAILERVAGVVFGHAHQTTLAALLGHQDAHFAPLLARKEFGHHLLILIGAGHQHFLGQQHRRASIEPAQHAFDHIAVRPAFGAFEK